MNAKKSHNQGFNGYISRASGGSTPWTPGRDSCPWTPLALRFALTCSQCSSTICLTPSCPHPHYLNCGAATVWCPIKNHYYLTTQTNPLPILLSLLHSMGVRMNYKYNASKTDFSTPKSKKSMWEGVLPPSTWCPII